MAGRKRDYDFGAPEVRAGICCGCHGDNMALFKLPGLLRWRCTDCYEREVGHRHHLAPPREPSRIVLP